MLTRRHIRVKVLQSLYAYYHTDEHLLDKQEKFLQYSIGQIKDLHALLLELMVAIRDHARDYLEKSQKKHLATSDEKNPSRTFVDNKILSCFRKMRCWRRTLKPKTQPLEAR
ncbi:MAG: hypothetical protein R2773_01825 [Flavobacteriaceae bacterium]